MGKYFTRTGLIVLIAVVFIAGVGTAYAGISLPTITLGGNVDVIGDMEFTADHTSLTFPSTSLPNQPMIEMFKSGTFNDNRMVLGHSQDFPTWGLEYRDIGDEFVFKSQFDDAVTIDLDNGDTHIRGDVTTDGAFGVEIQVIRDQDTVLVNGNFIKELSCPDGFVAISSGINPVSDILRDDSFQANDATGKTWVWRFNNPGPGTQITNFDIICMKTSVFSFN